MVLQTKNPIILLLLLSILSVGCSKGKSSLETVVIDNKAIPMMRTTDVSSLMSRLGVTRYRIKAKIWEMYDDSISGQYWYFPEGIYVEQFDSVFNVEASLSADTAYNYQKQELWRVIGNVKVVNLAGEKFETSELFWNVKDKTIYTDKFIRIERKGEKHEGYGMRSNQDGSNWVILNHSAEIDMPEENNTDSIQTDSISKTQPVSSKNMELKKQ